MATLSRRRSLVGRLSIRAALWAIVLGLTLVSLAVWRYWQVSIEALDASLAAEARLLADQITVSDDLLDIAVPLELRTRLENEQGYYAIFDARGQRLDGSGPNPPDAGVRPLVRSRGGYREVVVDGVRGATIVAGRSMEPIRLDVGRLAVSLLGASTFVIVLALPLTVWLRRQLADPLTHIDQTARALTLGHAARLDTARIDEEFAGVARALNEAFDRLEGALARERQLTSDVSHELRTPVATLVAETAWALGSPRTADEYRQSLAVCARQARRMKDLTEGLLTLARIEAGSLTLRRDPVDLRGVAIEALTDMQALAHERGVAVHVEGDATVVGDSIQLRTLVSNLVSNAIRYNRPHGSVTVRCGRERGRAWLEVEDTGPGLDAEQMAGLFSRFWRADDSRSLRDGGSGLGLAISKAVVLAHGGAIACRPAAPHGLVFTVEFPDVAAAPPEAAPMPPARNAILAPDA